MKFVSEKYPQLRVIGVGRFANGELEATDPAHVAQLKALPDEFGVRAVGGRPKAEDKKPASK